MSRETIISIVWLSIICSVLYFAIRNTYQYDKELRNHKFQIESIRDELQAISERAKHMIEVQTRFIELLYKIKNRDKIFYNIKKIMSIEEILKPKIGCGWEFTRKPLSENEFNHYTSIIEMLNKEIEELLKQ